MVKTEQLMPVEVRAVVDDEIERRFGGADTVKIGCGALVTLIDSDPTGPFLAWAQYQTQQ